MASLVGVAGVVAMLLFVPGLLRNLPQPALAAIVIAASLSLVYVRGLARLRRLRTSEFVLAVAAFLASPCSASCRGSGSPCAYRLEDRGE